MNIDPTEIIETVDKQGIVRGFSEVNSVPHHYSHPDLLVNYLDFWEIDLQSNRTNWVWITCIPLNLDPIEIVEKGGRTESQN